MTVVTVFHIESIIVFINFPLDFKQNFKALINNYNIFVNFLKLIL